ncbi:hypothetical protein VTO42DRAFT_3542 [Malbranchea cinnamomea]
MGEESDVEETPITFHVKSSSDAKWTLTLEPSTTVADLKAKLAGSDYADVPAARQRLIYSGKVLKDPETLGSYNVKDGHTIHLVKSAQSNQPPQPQASSSQSSTSQTPRGVPTNLAAGTGNNPLAGLTGARYAGLFQLPSAGAFGPDGGMGPPPDPETMLRMLENPQFQAQMNEALSNPHLVDMMIQQNPMLREMGPGVREVLQSPMFRRMLTDPNTLRQMAQMQRAMGLGPFGSAGGNTSFPAPGVTNTTPQENREQQNQTNQGSLDRNMLELLGLVPPPAGGTAPANPFASLFGGGPPATSGNAGNTTGNTTSTQSPGSTPAPASQPAAGSETSSGAAPGANQANPFAALFNPAFMQGAAANPNPNTQQSQAPPNPFFNPALFNQMMQSLSQNPPDPATSPLAALLGLGGTQSPPDNRPPEERYAQQLSQLNDMGFFDFDRNVEALRRAGGNVQGAVEYLLSNP